MTTTSDASHLTRLATASIAYNATWHTVAELLADGFSGPDAEFIAACSPAVILQLVALAAGGVVAGSAGGGMSAPNVSAGSTS